MSLKKFISKKIETAKAQNGWERMSKKRLEIVFSGKEKRNLKRAIDRHTKEFLSKGDAKILEKFEKIKIIKPPKEKAEPKQKTPSLPPPPPITRKRIYKDEILFYELVEDIEDAYRNLFLQKCYILSGIGSVGSKGVGGAIKEARNSGLMKKYTGDYVNNYRVDVFIIEYNGVKTEMEIIILEEWEYERKTKTKN